jgi:hypothetical protein
MAIKEIKNVENLVIDIFLKNGDRYIGCDITTRPCGENERTVSCWHGNKVLVFPLTEVVQFNLYEN